MKRIIARLLSFILLAAMTVSILCRTTANFPIVKKVLNIGGLCTEDGSWCLMSYEKKIVEIPYIGKIMEDISTPIGFVICLLVYFILLFVSRNKKARQSDERPALPEFNEYYDYESLGEASEEEMSLSEVSKTYS